MRDRLAVTGTERLGFDTSQHSHSSQHSQKLFFFLHQQRVLVELCTDPETIGENSSISKSYGRNNFEALTSHTRSVGASTERSSKPFFSSTVEYRMVPIEILVGYKIGWHVVIVCRSVIELSTKGVSFWSWRSVQEQNFQSSPCRGSHKRKGMFSMTGCHGGPLQFLSRDGLLCFDCTTRVGRFAKQASCSIASSHLSVFFIVAKFSSSS